MLKLIDEYVVSDSIVDSAGLMDSVIREHLPGGGDTSSASC